MRRDQLSRLGIQLPVLATIVLGGLPGPPRWAARLERAGLDVVCSGARPDTPGTWRAACQAVPHRPVKALAGDAAALAAAGCRLIEGPTAVAGAYLIDAGEAVVRAVGAASESVEDPSEVAATVLAALADAPAAGIWVAAGDGLARLPERAVEAKLIALAEGVRLARLVLAKHQTGE